MLLNGQKSICEYDRILFEVRYIYCKKGLNQILNNINRADSQLNLSALYYIIIRENLGSINQKGGINIAEKQTAGRDFLGKIAPEFARLNDDVLLGEVWSREEQLSARDRSLITISALFSAGLYPQLKAHIAIGKKHGLTKEELVETITQLAFYCGWPKAWSTFPIIEEIYGKDEE